jgi:hypothetical protein
MKDRTASLKKTAGRLIPDYMVSSFPGLFTAIADIKEVPKGAAVDEKNWITGTYKDHIELRPGMQLLGTTRNTGSGKITGLGKGVKNDGTEILFRSWARKLEYFNTTPISVSLGSYALDFDGVNDEISCGTNIITGTGSFSISGWVYDDVPNVGNFGLFGLQYGAGENHVCVVGKSFGSWFFSMSNGISGEVLYSSIGMNANAWNHICVVWDASINTFYIYINGTLHDSRATIFSTRAVGTNFFIGKWFNSIGTDFFYNGLVDDVRVWNGTALSSGDIVQLATYRLPTLTVQPTSYYKFDEGSGSIAIDTISGNNGTISGATYSTSRPSFTESYDWVEIGSDILPANASGEDICFGSYSSLAGLMMYVSSSNTPFIKIPLANPGSAVNQNTDLAGKFKIDQNRLFLFDYKAQSTGAKNKTGTILSFVDKIISGFTQVTGEVIGTGDGSTKTFTNTLVARTGVRTVFGLLISNATDTPVETFIDNYDGTLTGSLGGTGTINYATGAVSVTFNTAPTNTETITASYYWENSTSAGILDFTVSTTSGEAKLFPQSSAGNLMNIMSFATKQYCMHLLNTWVLTINADESLNTNLPFYERIGIPYWRSAIASGDGITFLNHVEKNNPRGNILAYNQLGQIVPSDLSAVLDFTPYSFDYAPVYDFANYDLVACQKKTLGVTDSFNSVVFMRNRNSNIDGKGYAWDKLEYSVSCFETYTGLLIAGDFLSSNVFVLFSGYDDDGEIISNFWTSGQSNLEVPGKKRFNRFEIDGFINVAQSFDIEISYDNGQFTKIGQIDGSGSYVDQQNGTMVGSQTLGQDVIGSSGSPNAYHFHYEFLVGSDIFEYVQVRFTATNIGALQINYYKFKDIRFKGRKALPVYNQQ